MEDFIHEHHGCPAYLVEVAEKYENIKDFIKTLLGREEDIQAFNLLIDFLLDGTGAAIEDFTEASSKAGVLNSPEVQAGRADLKKLLDRLPPVLDKHYFENEDRICGVLDALNDSQPDDTQQLVRLQCTYHFYFQVLSAFHASGRSDPMREVQTELSERLDIIAEALDILESLANKQDDEATIRKWSALWVKHELIVVAHSAYPQAGLHRLLQKLRVSSLKNLITPYIISILPIEGLASGKELPTRNWQVIKQLEGVLPPCLRQHIEKASAITTVVVALNKFEKGGNVDIVKATRAKASMVCLEDVGAEAEEKIKKLNSFWEASFREWVDSSTCSDFEEMHEYFSKFAEASKDGAYDDYPWVSTEFDEDLNQKMDRYVRISNTSNTNMKMATAISKLLKGTEYMKDVEKVVGSLKPVTLSEKAQRFNIVVAVVANACLTQPIDQRCLKRATNLMKKFGVEPSVLPAYLGKRYEVATPRKVRKELAPAAGAAESTSSATTPIPPADAEGGDSVVPKRGRKKKNNVG